jgi:hypothetical protein
MMHHEKYNRKCGSIFIKAFPAQHLRTETMGAKLK